MPSGVKTLFELSWMLPKYDMTLLVAELGFGNRGCEDLTGGVGLEVVLAITHGGSHLVAGWIMRTALQSGQEE